MNEWTNANDNRDIKEYLKIIWSKVNQNMYVHKRNGPNLIKT